MSNDHSTHASTYRALECSLHDPVALTAFSVPLHLTSPWKASFLLLTGAPWDLGQAPSPTPGPGSENAKAEDGTILGVGGGSERVKWIFKNKTYENGFNLVR